MFNFNLFLYIDLTLKDACSKFPLHFQVGFKPYCSIKFYARLRAILLFISYTRHYPLLA